MIGNEFVAVLLAAGYGSRISDVTDRPKCLLKVNGETLLERNFKIWKNLGIKTIHLVLGYKKELIEEVIESYKSDFTFKTYLNEDFRNKGNTFSLFLGIKELQQPCLIFDADLIYDESILQDFLNQGNDSQILVGEGNLNDIECAKTLVDTQNFARMTVDKRAVSADELSRYKFAGEAIGILKFSKAQTQLLSANAEKFLSIEKNWPLNWEHLLNQFLLNEDVGVHLFKKGRWVEIDNQEDLENATKLFGK